MLSSFRSKSIFYTLNTIEILTYLQDTALHTPDPSGTQTGDARKSCGPVE